MKHPGTRISLILAACLLLGSGCASRSPIPSRGSGGSARVEFVDPREFTDFTGSGPSGQADEPRMQAELTRFIQDEAARHLASDRKLEVRVLDIDQGGGTTAGPRRVRVADGNTTAEVEVGFVLRDGAGQEVKSGRKRLVESAASLPPGASISDMPLLKRALAGWIRELGQY